MIVLNYSHPLTDEQREQIETIMGRPIQQVITAPTGLTHFDQARSFGDQARDLVDSAGLTSADWQQKAILVNPPGLSSGAVTVMAELHGRMGYFPPVVRVAPVGGSLPPRYEVAEIINLQQLRDDARRRRE